MGAIKTAIVLDTRKVKKDNTFPVKLRITFERKQKYYPTPFSFSIKDFERLMFGKKFSEKEKVSKRALTEIENKALDIIKSLSLFSWESFEKHLFTNKGAKYSIHFAFSEYANELRKNGRIGTAVSYECAQNSLKKFAPGAKFADITPGFLNKYEKWMLANGNSITTVGIYLRSLRTLFNNAIAEGFFVKEYYPFGKKRYEIPTANNIKKALSLKDIGAIFRYQAEPGSMIDRAKDYWIFMYLCNGINVKDMSLLKYCNLKDEVIEFVRAKTARTKRKVEPIRVILTDELKKIIAKWGNKKIDDNTFIFPILENGLTPERERQLIQQTTHLINDYMKVIAKILGIDKDVTTYSARHSFATVLQRSGASISFISEALGHSSTKTTQSYLAGFEDESKREALKALTAFE